MTKKSVLHYHVSREFQRVRKEIEPGLIADSQDRIQLRNAEFRNVMIAQNVVRECLEAVINELLPFSHMTAMELAIRTASYALSVAPMEDQAKLTSLFLQAFPMAHEARLAMGIVIQTDWEAGDGNIVTNHPTGPITEPKGGI